MNVRWDLLFAIYKVQVLKYGERLTFSFVYEKQHFDFEENV